MSENNPFTPPESNLQPPPSGHRFIHEFPRLPTLLFIGLGLLTMGLYVYAWIYTRNAMLNRCLPEAKRIPSWLSNSTVALGVISFGMSIFSMLTPESNIGSSVQSAQGLFGMMSFIMTIVWLFNFRANLNYLTGAQPGDRLWVNGILLVLFTAYYLQYKLNQVHDFGETDITPPPSGGDGSSRQGHIEL